MAKLISTLKKEAWEDWVGTDWFSNPNAFFTNEEYVKIVEPYTQYVRSLPGYDTSSYRVIQNGNEIITVRQFDTVENATNAMNKLSMQTDEPSIKNMQILLDSKQKQAGVNYKREEKVVP